MSNPLLKATEVKTGKGVNVYRTFASKNSDYANWGNPTITYQKSELKF